MSNKNEMHKSGWYHPMLNLKKLFDEEQFDEISKYVTDNTIQVQNNWLNYRYFLTEPKPEKLNLILKFGSERLSYFERTFCSDPRDLAIFKLGCLAGNLDCLSAIEYEYELDAYAMYRYGLLKSKITLESSYYDDVILAIYNRKHQHRESFENLLSTLSINSNKLKIILYDLLNHGFITSCIFSPDIIVNNSDHYELIDKDKYILTEYGNRVSLQLKNAKMKKEENDKANK